MRFIHLFTGDDGKSHVEPMTLESHPELGTLQATKGIQFRELEAGYFYDWHTAPRKQFVICLAGEMEIGLEDGSVHKLGAGDVLLAEDLKGKGHTMRTGNETRIGATVPLED
ncbi:MAG TPA: hypothetical protein VKU60_16940 [Chloroflexota bacterium]|nr:hypothetical protein [Chloroflexota bacterium]